MGKSSLLNALAQRDRAIVTPIPGTTRDLVEDTIHIRGVKFTVTDTAGLRTPGDAIEKEGIERVRKSDTGGRYHPLGARCLQAYTPEDEEVCRAVAGRKVIAVLNKADLPPMIDAGDGDGRGPRRQRGRAHQRERPHRGGHRRAEADALMRQALPLGRKGAASSSRT